MDFDVQNQQESGISLSDIFRIIRINWILIVTFTILVGIGVGVYSYTLVPDRYKSSSEVLIQVPLSQTGDGINLLDTQRLVQTASEFIKSDYIVNNLRTSGLITDQEYSQKLSNMTNTQIKNGISVVWNSTSFIIRISFTSTDPAFAQEMAAAITAVAISNDVDMFQDKFVELSEAGSPEDDSPNKVLFIVVGLIGGAILGIAIAFMRQLFNNAYMTKEQLEMGTSVQVIGVIPEFEFKERKR